MTASVTVALSPTSVDESGTTNLTYTFTRTGDTSLALTVNLELGGKATAVDYSTNIVLASGSAPAKAWTKLLGSSGDDYANALTTGLDGSIYVSGMTVGSLDGQTNSGGFDAFLTKYNADGTKAWTKLLGSSSSDYAYALTTGLDGSIYVGGFTEGALDGQTNSGSRDTFLTKYSADGTKAWTQLLGSSGSDQATALTTGLDGSIYVSGVTSGALDGQTNSGSLDTFLTKYSADGIKAWTQLLGSSGIDYAYAVTTGLDGSIYVSGVTNGSLDGQTNSGGGDAFLTKYSADGTKAWTKLLGSSGSDEANALTTGLDGSIYFTGSTDGAFDGQTNSGGSDAFLTKFSVSPQITFAAGSATATLVFTPTADNLVEGSETLAITVLAGSGYTLGEAVVATGTIVDTNHIPTGSTTITGTAMQGQALTATNTLADTDGIGTISYQWQAAGVNISGATANSLVLAEAQVGKAITVSASV